MTKIIFSALLTVALVVGVCGCSNSKDNPFTVENALKAQIDDLYYVVPNNAVIKEEHGNQSVLYTVPIENSKEEYYLNINIEKYETENKEETIENFEKGIQFNKDVVFNGEDVKYTTEEIYEFADTKIDKGVKIIIERNGKKDISYMVIKFPKAYSVSYSAKAGFFDEAVWDNFYSQLKYVGLDNDN